MRRVERRDLAPPERARRAAKKAANFTNAALSALRGATVEEAAENVREIVATVNRAEEVTGEAATLAVAPVAPAVPTPPNSRGKNVRFADALAVCEFVAVALSVKVWLVE